MSELTDHEPGMRSEAAAVENLGTVTIAVDVQHCRSCSHPQRLHFTEGADEGCAGRRPAVPAAAMERAGGSTAGDRGEAARCRCAGYVAGALPHAITKHLDPLTADPEVDCPDLDCFHPLAEHSDTHGCWHCPCDRRIVPTHTTQEIQ